MGMSTQAPTHEAGGALWTRYVELEMERTAITDGVQDDPLFERYEVIRDEQKRLRMEMGEDLFGELQRWI